MNDYDDKRWRGGPRKAAVAAGIGRIGSTVRARRGRHTTEVMNLNAPRGRTALRCLAPI